MTNKVKVPGGAFYAGDGLTVDQTTRTVSAGGGGSVPKPLTYDYMPEGYPTKAMETVTLMEEQEVAFVFNSESGVYVGALLTGIEIAVGQTYRVNWDGTEYECVGEPAFNGNASILGNLSLAGLGVDTGEPFLYLYNNTETLGSFATLDTSASHTISVKTTAEAIAPMAEEFIPDTVATKSDAEAAQSTANAAKTAADNAQRTADNAQTTAENAQTTANTALERAVEPYTRNTPMAPLYKNGGFSAWRKVLQEISYNKTEGYFFVNEFDTTALKIEDMPEGVFCAQVYVGNNIAMAFLSKSATVNKSWFVTGFAVIIDGYSRTGEVLYVSSNTISQNEAKGLFLTFRAPDSMLLKSSTAGSTKQFRITVDDSGTIRATEVTA